MVKYIEQEVAVKAFNNFDAGRASGTHSTLLTPEEFAEYLYELPTADVAPVIHGRWISKNPNGYEWIFVCSNCDYVDGYPFNDRHNYCPNCGVKMDGGNENG